MGGLSPAEAGRWERERGDEREAELRELGPAAQGERTSLAPRAPLPSSRGGGQCPGWAAAARRWGL